jgi:threonyl-tRNA synthetase
MEKPIGVCVLNGWEVERYLRTFPNCQNTRFLLNVRASRELRREWADASTLLLDLDHCRKSGHWKDYEREMDILEQEFGSAFRIGF